MIQCRKFGSMPSGDEVNAYKIQNSSGMSIELMNLGATILSINVSDKNGIFDDIALGFDTPQDYLKTPYFGSIVGRYGNRIKNGCFSLDGINHELARNDGENHLHGGINGFNSVLWKADLLENENALLFSYFSADGEENYPGNLQISVKYTLFEDNSIRIDYHATCDKATILNPTNHSYFNLNGHASGDILEHEVFIDADKFTVIDSSCIPTGELRNVSGTPFDFKTASQIAKRLKENSDYEQIQCGKGFDHNFVLNNSEKLKNCVRLYSPKSGRLMEVFTDQPGVQFYTGNFIKPSTKGKNSAEYNRHSGLCFETQHYPDSPNHPDFPSTVLRPNEKFASSTIYKFSSLSRL